MACWSPSTWRWKASACSVASLAVVWLVRDGTLLAAGAFLPVAGLPMVRRRIASLDVGLRVPTAEMAVLRATDLFAPLPSALGRLA